MLNWMRRSPEIEKANELLNEINRWCGAKDRSIQAKHWQMLSEYAADMVKELSKVSALDLDTGRSVKVDPDDEKLREVRTSNGLVKVVGDSLNARVKRQDPLKEELRERRQNGIDE